MHPPVARERVFSRSAIDVAQPGSRQPVRADQSRFHARGAAYNSRNFGNFSIEPGLRYSALGDSFLLRVLSCAFYQAEFFVDDAALGSARNVVDVLVRYSAGVPCCRLQI